MKIYPPSYLNDKRSFEIVVTICDMGDDIAQGFVLLTPDDLMREDLINCVEALKTTQTQIEGIIDLA